MSTVDHKYRTNIGIPKEVSVRLLVKQHYYNIIRFSGRSSLATWSKATHFVYTYTTTSEELHFRQEENAVGPVGATRGGDETKSFTQRDRLGSRTRPGHNDDVRLRHTYVYALTRRVHNRCIIIM